MTLPPDRTELERRIAALEAENARLQEQLAQESSTRDTSAYTQASRAFRLLSEHVSDVIWTVDLHLQPLYLSPSAERLLGFPVQDGLQHKAGEIMTAASLQHAERMVEAVIRGDRSFLEGPIELELVRRDGTTVWTESLITQTLDAQGQVSGFIGLTRDVSERRQTQEELRSRNELLETIFTNLRQIFFSLDVEHMRVAHLSSACEAIYGLPQEEFYRNPMAWFDPVIDEDRAALMSGFEALRSGERDESVAEYRIRRQDGTVRWLRSRTRTHKNDDGVIDYFHGFVTDISARKRLEEQLLQAQKMEAVGTLAGGVAHDMNNVLGVVMGLSSVLQAGLEESHPMRRHVEGILGATRRGRDLTRNLLGFARKGRFRREHVLLNDVVEECLELVQRTMSKSIVVRTRLTGTLDYVEGDPSQLNHALMNLCLNAGDAMPEGGTLIIDTANIPRKHLDQERFPKLTAKRYVRLQVTDTGEGIAPETLGRVFEPFFTTKQRGRGTGLGLSMVYGTINNHGGAIELDSAVGHGTTVTMLLPSAPLSQPALRPAAASREMAALPQEGTVLLVDDEELFRYTGELMLTQLGYTVISVDNGAAALTQYGKYADEVVLVVLDLQMPVMDGEETFEKLRAMAPDVPVLLCSGYALEKKAERLMNAGARGYLHKPFEVATLRRAIERALTPTK